MLRPLATRLIRPQGAGAVPFSSVAPAACAGAASSPSQHMIRKFSTAPDTTDSSTSDSGGGVGEFSPEEMRYFHFNRLEKPRPKFKSPRKRASKLFAELNAEAVAKSKEGNPAVWNVPFRVGDAIEITSVNQGGVASADVEKIRGVVLGRVNRGLASSVILRDVIMGQPIERKIMLHSPLIKSLKVLEENFVYKGKRKVKRAKLYFLRDRKPEECRVTKW